MKEVYAVVSDEIEGVMEKIVSYGGMLDRQMHTRIKSLCYEERMVKKKRRKKMMKANKCQCSF